MIVSYPQREGGSFCLDFIFFSSNYFKLFSIESGKIFNSENKFPISFQKGRTIASKIKK